MFLWTFALALAAAWALGWRWRVLALLLGMFLLPPVVPTAFWFKVWRGRSRGSSTASGGPRCIDVQRPPPESHSAGRPRSRSALVPLCGGFLLVAHSILLLSMAASVIGLIVCLVPQLGWAGAAWAAEHLGAYCGLAVLALLILSVVLAARAALCSFYGRGRVRFISDEEVLLMFLLCVPWLGYLCWRSIIGRASPTPTLTAPRRCQATRQSKSN